MQTIDSRMTEKKNSKEDEAAVKSWFNVLDMTSLNLVFSTMYFTVYETVIFCFILVISDI